MSSTESKLRRDVRVELETSGTSATWIVSTYFSEAEMSGRSDGTNAKDAAWKAAFKLIHQAVQEDQKKDFEHALALYTEAVGQFINYLKRARSEIDARVHYCYFVI